MSTVCGINCGDCPFENSCAGCEATCGKPFGGSCIAAECILAEGKPAYEALKARLLTSINEALAEMNIPKAERLYELCGAYINLPFPLPGGETAKLLDDSCIYLGCQIEGAPCGRCYGAAAGRDFVIISSYGENGADPELLLYRKIFP